METFIFEDEWSQDEQWEIIRIFAYLRRKLRDFRKPEAAEEMGRASAANML